MKNSSGIEKFKQGTMCYKFHLTKPYNYDLQFTIPTQLKELQFYCTVQFCYVQMLQHKIYNCLPTHTGHSYSCSIGCPRHIAPRSDSVLVDVSLWSNVFRDVAGFSHRTVPDNEIPPPTSNVVDINTVDNVRLNTCQIERERSFPEKRTSVTFKITDSM